MSLQRVRYFPVFVVGLGCFFSITIAHSQSTFEKSPLGSIDKGYVDIATNPFSAMNYFAMFDDESGESYSNLTDMASAYLNSSDQNYFILLSDEIDAESEMAKMNYLFVKTPKGKVKVSFLILEGNGFYLSCLKPTNVICDCGSELVIYVPNSNTLKRVERPFSFSLKRNLIYRLGKFGFLELEPGDFKNLCHLLHYLD